LRSRGRGVGGTVGGGEHDPGRQTVTVSVRALRARAPITAIEDRLPATTGHQLATVNYLEVLVITGFAAVAVTNTLLVRRLSPAPGPGSLPRRTTPPGGRASSKMGAL
jgi:hypothetical protein